MLERSAANMDLAEVRPNEMTVVVVVPSIDSRGETRPNDEGNPSTSGS